MLTQFAGYVPLGNTIYIPIVTHAATLAPAAPDGDVAAEIYTGPNIAAQSTQVATGLTAAAVTGITGGFVLSYECSTSNGFAAGSTYYVFVSWEVSSVVYRSLFIFTVI